MKYWEIIADRLRKAGWSWGCVSAVDAQGRTNWIADAHRGDGKRYLPVPVRLTGCAPPPSWRTFRDAVRSPVAVGLNLTSMVQLEFAGTLEPQFVVSIKSPKLSPLIA